MNTTLIGGKDSLPSNVIDFQSQRQRQRRIARRMAMQTITLQLSYPYLFPFIRYAQGFIPYSTSRAIHCT